MFNKNNDLLMISITKKVNKINKFNKRHGHIQKTNTLHRDVYYVNTFNLPMWQIVFVRKDI